MDGGGLQRPSGGISTDDRAGYGGFGQIFGKGQEQGGCDPLIGVMGGGVQDVPGADADAQGLHRPSEGGCGEGFHPEEGRVPPHQSPNAKAAQAGSHGYVGGYHWEVHWHPHGRPDWQPLRVQGGVSGGNGLGGGAITGSQLPVGISRLDADCAVSQQIGFQSQLGFRIGFTGLGQPLKGLKFRQSVDSGPAQSQRNEFIHGNRLRLSYAR